MTHSQDQSAGPLGHTLRLALAMRGGVSLAVWIGGAEHPDLVEPHVGGAPCEYNTAIDIASAQVVLDDSDIPLWQVPRDAYRQVISTMDELGMWLRPCGAIGEHLFTDRARGRDAGEDRHASR